MHKKRFGDLMVNKKKRFNITLSNKHARIIEKIIERKDGINTKSGAIEWALKKSLIFILLTEAEVYHALKTVLPSSELYRLLPRQRIEDLDLECINFEDIFDVNDGDA